MGEIAGTDASTLLLRKDRDTVLPKVTPIDKKDNVESDQATHHGQSSVFDLSDTIIGKVSRNLQKSICVIALPMMTFVISLEIIFRYVLGKGFRWSQEACCILLLLLCIGCQANCFQKDRHIRMDLIYNHAGKLFKNLSNVLTIICGGIFFGSLMFQAMMDIPYQISVNESTEEMYFPIWILNSFIVGSCACLVAALVRHSFRMIFKK